MKKIKIIEQMEHSECGLACVAMILNYHGIRINLANLREKYGVPTGGFNLLQLRSVLDDYGLNGQSVSIKNLDMLDKQHMPFIALWKDQHFIIVEGVKKK